MIPETVALDIANCCDDLARTWVEQETALPMHKFVAHCTAEFRDLLRLAIHNQLRECAAPADRLGGEGAG